MSYEQDRLKRINALMGELHGVCDDIYEALCDQDFPSVEYNLRKLSDLVDYIRKSISNEI
jgi:hypothetical protein